MFSKIGTIAVQLLIGASLILTLPGCMTAQTNDSPIDNPLILSSSIGSLPPKEFDEALTRWDSGCDHRGFLPRVAAFPLTTAFVRSAATTEALKIGKEQDLSEEFGKSLVTWYVDKLSCIDVFITSDADEYANLDYYDLKIQNLDGKNSSKAVAMNPTTREQRLVVGVMQQLLEINVPMGHGPRETVYQVGNKIFNRPYSRSIVCGKKIDFGKPFSLIVTKRLEEKCSWTISWKWE